MVGIHLMEMTDTPVHVDHLRYLRRLYQNPNPITAMNQSSKTILLGAGFGAGLILTSCVEPYGTSISTNASVAAYRPGYSVSALPSGYRTESISGADYYYNDGAYYQRRRGNYVVVNAPRSSRYYDEYTRYGRQTVHNHRDGSAHVISELPRGYTKVNYRGEPYYRHENRYYRRQGSGYVLVASPF